MPQHKSAEKRVRQNAKRRARNRYHRSKIRTMIKTLQDTTDADEAASLYRDVQAYLDRLSTKGILHKNKVGHYKSHLSAHVESLSA